MAICWFVDEVFISVAGKQHLLWRAVDQDGDVLDIPVQRRRNRAAAERFFRKVLTGQGDVPRRTVTDGLKSYPAVIHTVLQDIEHDTTRYANNRAEYFQQHTLRRERQMQRFKSIRQAQRCLGLYRYQRCECSPVVNRRVTFID